MTRQPPAPSVDWAYFLDVDGTLIDLADTPDTVRVDTALLHLIRDLHRRASGALALVSGRSLSDLDRLLGDLRLPMAGQHGLERRDGQGHIHRQPIPPARLRAIVERLASLRRRHPGLLLEDKGASLAVHYRLAPRLGGYLHRLLGEAARDAAGGLELQAGKRVVEIKPAGHDKGGAIGEFMSRHPFSGRTPVFIGDDLTDEHGFTMVNRLGGISIKVGSGRSQADYRLAGVAAVRAWLSQAVAHPAPPG